MRNKDHATMLVDLISIYADYDKNEHLLVKWKFVGYKNAISNAFLKSKLIKQRIKYRLSNWLFFNVVVSTFKVIEHMQGTPSAKTKLGLAIPIPLLKISPQADKFLRLNR